MKGNHIPATAGDVTGCTFSVNGVSYMPVARDGMLSATYAPMNYLVRMGAEQGNLQTLMTALYNYHLAAKILRTAA